MQGIPPPNAQQVAESIFLDGSQRAKLLGYACRRFGIRAADAEDLLQDTAVQLLRYNDYVRNPEGFVFAVFRNLCVHFGRATKSDQNFGEESRNSGDSFALADRLYSRMALKEALATVSESCRRLLSAYYLQGQSLREAAQTLSLAHSSVAKTISRCLRKLQECLE